MKNSLYQRDCKTEGEKQEGNTLRDVIYSVFNWKSI